MDIVIKIRNYIKNRDFEKFSQEVEENIEILKNSTHGKILILLDKALKQSSDENILKEVENTPDLSGLELSDLALVYLLSGNEEKAEKLLKEAIKKPDIDEATYARLAAVYYSQEKIEEARYYWERSLEINPKKVEVLYNLASLYIVSEQLEKALDYLNRALLLKPDFKEAEDKRTLILISLNQIDKLIEEYYSQLEKEKTPQVYLKLGNVLHIAGRYPEARSILFEAVEKFPWDIKLKMLLLEVLTDEGATFKAGTLLKEWLENTDWIDEEKTENKEELLKELQFKLNELRVDANFIDTAEEDLEKIEDKENYPQYYIIKSKILMERNKGIEAAKVLKEAKEKFPAHIGILSQLTHVLTSIGETEEAKEIQAQIVAINPAAVIQQVEMENYKATDEQIEALYNLLNSIAMPKETRASAGFVLHKVLEKKKEYDEAFEVLIKANELIKETISYDWKEHRILMQKSMEVFTPELVEKLKDKGHPSKRPIFVLGMPRSGTTLTEQILGTHSLVYPAGELGFVPKIVSLIPKVFEQQGKKPIEYPEALLEFDEFLLKAAGQYYLDKVSQLDKEHPYIVDKLPHNFDYVGFILLMFPNAKIIHLVRDDLDVAVSNYQQNFAAKHGTMGFAFDLKWIGHMLNDHRAIMEHWHKLFPGRIYDLDYKRLTEEPETVIREILEFCGLPWEDKVLEFYKTKRPVKTASIKQVRQGIYKSSVEKWRRYEKFLKPTIDILKEGFKKIDEYETGKYEDVVKPSGIIGYTISV